MTTMRTAARYFAILLLSFLLMAPARAQTTAGTVTGVITESAGAPVPQATVRLSSEATGFAQTATTGEDGAYVFPLVSPGTYQITIEREGFQRFVRAFTLAVAQQARIDAQLT